jgi:hypothetical protein
LTEEEYNNLEQSIVTEGCRDALVLWNGYLIDGHNRYEICTKHGIEFKTIEKPFESRNDVRIWILQNQLSRRNLSTPDRIELALQLEEFIKQKARGNNVTNSFSKAVEKVQMPSPTLANPVPIKSQVCSPIDSREEIAKIAGVSHGTFSKYKLIKEKAPEMVIRKIKNGDISINKAYKDIKREEKKEEEARKIKELKIVEQIEPEADLIKCELGAWYKLGDHLLYCGSNNDESFLNGLKEHPASFAFADPPYNADVAEWDSNFTWSQDWLIDYAPIVAVTPGIVSIYDFMNSTSMPYSWSVACWIDNGMTRGALGFGNWIYIALFSKESLYRNSQDFLKVTISNSETKETTHKGRKPASLIAWLFERFSKTSDYIIDPFLGSGTSLLIAEKMDRCCIGAEINPEYCEAIISRWEQMTGEKVSVYED